MTLSRIEWRHQRSSRWTKAHIVALNKQTHTLCGIEIPLAYDIAYDEWIPSDTPSCQRCLSRNEILNKEVVTCGTGS